MISQTTITKIHDLDLSEVIGHFTDIKKKGPNYFGLSPFTDEKSPSFSVNDRKPVWKCFSTGTSGVDAIGFVMKKLNLSYPDAIKEICNKTNITVEYDANYDSEAEKEKREEREDLYKLNNAAALHYKKLLIELQDSQLITKMFKRWRHLDPETLLDAVITFELGYAPDVANFLSSQMVEKGYYDGGIKLGLIKTKEGKNYDTFRHRFMFPIRDENQRYVGFGGRSLTDDKKYPKYINSTESDIYNKSNILYGLHIAGKHIREQKFAYITEGYTDVISCHLGGMQNTVGTCGTALTEQQIKLLKRYTTKVVLLYDADAAGIKASLSAIHLFIGAGFEVHVAQLPGGQDPDEFVTSYPAYQYAYKFATPALYISKKQVEGIKYKAAQLLDDCTNPILRQDHFQDIARTLAQIEGKVIISDIGKKIAKKYDIDWTLFNQMITEQKSTLERKNERDGKKLVRKNKKVELTGSATNWPFFEEVTDNKGNYKEIVIKKVKLVQLLQHFGYCRYAIGEGDSYTFIHLDENKIRQVKRDQIIDHIMDFAEHEYDYEGAGFDYVDAEELKEKLLGGMKTYFSKDLFARVRPEAPIIINEDDKDNTYLYFRNGFVTINKEGWKLQPYEEMNGSVWDDQIIDFDFVHQPTELALENIAGEDDEPKYRMNAGIFADFVFRVSGGYKALDTEDKDEQNRYWKRFYSLCSIIGYLSHDFYQYDLKAILFTDSSLSDDADGRSGKTLLGRLIGHVRSYCELNGKDFDSNDKNKYQTAKLGTQLVHLNDLKTKGRNKFDIDSVYNDITEGYMVKHLYLEPFRNYSKFMWSTNKTINISGGSERDRVIEFEFSDYFSENYKPAHEYGHWLMRDWDDAEWIKYYNFMCFCGHLFHDKGIILPSTINLEARRLKDHTHEAFIEFMDDIKAHLKAKGTPWHGYETSEMFEAKPNVEMTDFEFDKNKLFDRFKELYGESEGFNKQNWFHQKAFTKWLKMYAELAMGVKKPHQPRKNGKNYIRFIEEVKK